MRLKLLVLAGGVGTRLWPLSRTQFPKQFLRLPLMGRSMFQQTIERCLGLGAPADIYVLTQPGYRDLVHRQLDEMGCPVPSENILYEPQMKNTLPAIYNGVRHIARQGHAPVAVFASDHLVEDVPAFLETVRLALPLAADALITFGVTPTGPETGYGYICPGDACGPGFWVREFKEKPDLATARQYVADGYFWNSGMFLFDSAIFCREVAQHAPDVFAAFDGTNTEQAFAATPSVSIDYGVLEHSSRVAVVLLKSDWSDLGSFLAFYDTYRTQLDETGNFCPDGTVLLDANDNLVIAESGKTVALVDVESLVVVDQPDALLICGKHSTQRVKEVVRRLALDGNYRADRQMSACREWGSFTVLSTGVGYLLRSVSVAPGKTLCYRAAPGGAHCTVVQGCALFLFAGSGHLMKAGEHAFLLPGEHCIENRGPSVFEFIEVQTGDGLTEDDRFRLDDGDREGQRSFL